MPGLSFALEGVGMNFSMVASLCICISSGLKDTYNGFCSHGFSGTNFLSRWRSLVMVEVISECQAGYYKIFKHWLESGLTDFSEI